MAARGRDRDSLVPVPRALVVLCLVVLCLVVLVLASAWCARGGGRKPGPASGRRGAGTPEALAAQPAPAAGEPARPGQRASTGACLQAARRFSCLMRSRVRAVERYLARQPGKIGVVLHDRVTGATWRSPNAAATFPAASTIKLAMAADLLLRASAGAITLGAHDWDLVHAALHESSDTAADQLWSTFENGRFLRRIRRLGMTGSSFSASPPYWGYMYCSPEDLDNLMNYVLGELPGPDRGYLVRQLRHVARIQQWGVWGAGLARRPGNKDGWEDDGGIWVTDTVGFAGPGARYTLAIMDIMPGHGGFRAGANTLTQVSSLLFRGVRAPRPTAEATP